MIVSFHESYSEFTKFQGWLRQFFTVSTFEFNSFIIDLTVGAPGRPLTFRALAEHILSINSKPKWSYE
ncbi:MAG TPA: hypothetical protein VK487_11320 [Candidatus Bathyarchaeia archaeon]|nr:hypothetical protein [Candidatus Bathyarchaeia archaeon]